MPTDYHAVPIRRTSPTSAAKRITARALMATALGLVLLMSGCTKTDEPVEKPTTPPVTATPTPSVTTDPTPTPEPEPEPTLEAPDPSQVINENTAEGAKSAVEYFFALYNYAHRDRSIDIWQPISAKDCNFCAKVTSGITELLDGNQFIEGGELEIVDLGKITEIEDTYWSVELSFFQHELFLRSADQSLLARDDPYEATGVMFVEFIDGQWLLVDLG